MPRNCPQCGATLDKITAAHGGAISEPMIRQGDGAIFRQVRPATFYACMRCEYCVEVGR